MATIRVATDNIQNYSADKKTVETFAEKLRQAGHTVTVMGVGSNLIQRTMLKSSNKCDIMIQVAGGKCLGTLVDFYTGLGKYYHASAGGFAYFKCWDPNWKSYRAWDDGFSSESSLKPYKGKTLPEIYKIMSEKKKMYYGYGNTAEDCAKTFLANMGGPSTTTNNTNNSGDSGSSGFELIKQVCSDLDPYGVEAFLTGDTLNIRRTNPNTAVPLTPDMITTGQITFNDYDNSTPNENNGYKDTYLIERYGVIPMDSVDSSWKEQILLMAQRGHGHSIELQCVLDYRFVGGKWVKLTIPDLGIIERPYYITKHSYEGDITMSLTLEPGPPSLYVDVQEIETEVTEEETEEVEE